MAAAAAISHLKSIPHKLRSHDDDEKDKYHSNAQPTRGSDVSEEQKEAEKRHISTWEDHKQSMSSEQIMQTGDKKQVGYSSSVLAIDDFELEKTLGTGVYQSQVERNSSDSVM